MSSQYAVNLEEVGKLIAKAKTLARRYRELTGRPIGITGEVAEYEAMRLLGLNPAKVRQAGYDAIRSRGRVKEYLQIKGRCILTNNPGQRLGKIDLKHQWDAVLLVLLDVDFEPTAIYEAKREATYAFNYIDHRYKYTVVAFDHTGNYRAVIADSLAPVIP